MGYCYFCEKKPCESWGGYWCEDCRKIKNLGNVYGFERILNILTKCCIRDTQQLEGKIEQHQKSVADKKKNVIENVADDRRDYDRPPHKSCLKPSQYKNIA